MITAKNITKKQAGDIFQLIEQWTRCEIIARHAPLVPEKYTKYYETHIAIADKLREKLFGTANLYDLGIKWGILKEQPTRKERRKQNQKSKKKSEVHPLLLHKMNKHKKETTDVLLKKLKEAKDPKEKRKIRRLLRKQGRKGGLGSK